ncbi:metallophosphoesterase [Neobacillus sp. D3-1R]|uniref:metallophosphoesterase n=1 Tax=Neobacillus sp. D3-1R TaxID=3445778 RepID=UPI003F9F8DAB
MSTGKKVILIILLTTISFLVISNDSQAQDKLEPTITVRILETTDLHANMLAYDYKNRKGTVEFGLARTASLIKDARREQPNTLLFDVGDALVGNALGEYVSKSPMMIMDTHPVYSVMNTLHYDAATLGNHEFNYGLNFLIRSLRGADFPYVNANIYVDDHNKYDADDLNYFNPYTIVEKEFLDSTGKKHQIKVGVIGFITPIAAEWDKEAFYGKLKIKNIKETAEYFVPIMKSKGADIIVALAHTGMESDMGLKQKKGNSVYALSKVKGIDAILYGHTHSLFPSKDRFTNKEGMNLEAGTIHGTATVQAGYWGNHLGIIDLKLVRENKGWDVVNSHSYVKSIFRTVNDKKIPVVPSDRLIEKMMEGYHREVLGYMKRKN